MTKWNVYLTKGEYEPWWFFEEWETSIQADFAFSDKEAAFLKYQELADELLRNYPNHQTKKDYLLAAWNEEEVEYCEDCEDDIQTFHGLILFSDGEVYQPTPEEKETIFKPVLTFA
ncbi:TPA: DUF1033 family protein [Listeria monocytogenes]|nr:DUF1033 family protein [Listeria monocytogenes]